MSGVMALPPTEVVQTVFERAKEIAEQRASPQLTPVHVASALFEDDAALGARIVSRAGGDINQIRQALESALSRIPHAPGTNERSSGLFGLSMSRFFDSFSATSMSSKLN